jgi:hypothetical protein
MSPAVDLAAIPEWIQTEVQRATQRSVKGAEYQPCPSQRQHFIHIPSSRSASCPK